MNVQIKKLATESTNDKIIIVEHVWTLIN